MTKYQQLWAAALAVALFSSAVGASELPPAATDQADDVATDTAADAPIDPASDPPALLPEKKLRTRVTGRSRSELFLEQRPRMRRVGGGYVQLQEDNVFPFYETIDLRADEIGHRGLSLHFQGWAGVDLAALYFDERAVADVTYLYLQFRHKGVDAKLGRMQIYDGVMRGLHMDGLNAVYESPWRIGLQLFGGSLVRPRIGPDWYRSTPDDVDYDDFGRGFSEWDRDGDWTFGGRAFYRMLGVATAGVSAMRTSHLGEVDQQLVGADLLINPHKAVDVAGDLALDLFAERLREANLSIDVQPSALYSFSVDYRHADPSLYLSKMSIFSVFSNEQYDAVGGSLRLYPAKGIALDARYHHHFYGFFEKDGLGPDKSYDTDWDTGYEVRVGGRAVLAGDAMVIVDFRRFTETETGLNQVRMAVNMPIFVDGLRAHSNVYLDVYDDDINGENVGLLGDLGVHFSKNRIQAGGAVTAGFTPLARHEVAGMLKFAYNFDLRYFEDKTL